MKLIKLKWTHEMGKYYEKYDAGKCRPVKWQSNLISHFDKPFNAIHKTNHIDERHTIHVKTYHDLS